ncbi:MAG: Ig-like domain-containing protein [Prevotellaceae bacterium]|nr:Ig-like domain-containing protein [Prevotellaceae bacterium]
MKKQFLWMMLCIVCALSWQTAQAQSKVDITDLYITNPGFELSSPEGWNITKSSDTGVKSTSNETYAMSNSEGKYLFNTYWQGTPIYQTITNLPAGDYTLSAVVASDGATIYLISGDNSEDYAYVETTNKAVGILIEKTFTLTERTNYKIGVVGGDDGTAGEHKPYREDGYWWYKADDFKLHLNVTGNNVPEAFDAEVKNIVAELLQVNTMATAVKASLSSASATYNSNTTIANLQTLLSAIKAARTSIASYQTIAGGVIPTTETTNWDITTPKGELACNTWSNEGDTDGSGMTTPFIQDWVGSGTPLGEGNLYYTLAGLNPGEKYTVTARVRVLNEAEGNVVEGATFYVNGESKDITEICTKGKYAIVSVSAEVNAEGKLEFGVHSSSTSQFNWMAIKDVTIAEYAGVKVSNISFNTSNANLTTGRQLTLVATVTPDNADDKTLTWTSSDPNVASVTASGVVTALAAGTTTITAKANDGSEATASATITVANAEAPTWFSAVNTGEFYIRNVGTGRFLGQGNSWDTQASLIVHGKPIKVTASNGKYKLTEIVKANAGLGADCYTDNGTPVELTIAEVSPGIYTIDYNGALTAANAGNTIVSYQNIDKTNALAQWQFLTRDDMERNLWTGSDATFYVKGALAQRDASTNSAWTASNVTTSFGDGDLSPTNAYVCSESWHKDAFSYTQTATVPNGKYKVSVQGFNNGTSDAKLIANEANVQLRAQSSENHGMTCNSRTTAAKVFEAGYYHNEVEVTVTNNTLKLGVEGSSKDCWVAWNNFELELLEYTHVNSITATPEENEIIIGKTTTITTTIDPEDASFPTVYYTSSNEAIATVNQDGLVNALATGDVTITAMANNQSAKVEISVIEPPVIPTGVTLNETNIELTATSNTATLTATVGPEGAPQDVVWSTADATIATVSAEGKVEGVLPGTTTIRATALGFEDVYAEATVTVTYAESEVPEPDYKNDNATRTLYMPGDNLIKNGSFEYADPFYGWTNAASGALAKDKFKVETEGDEKYLVGTTNEGSDKAGSLRMVWEIEKDKTYTFSYRVKALAANAVGKEQEFLVTSLTNTVGTETKKLGLPTTTAEWTTKNYTFTNTDGYKYVQICFRWLSNQFGFDNFYLSEITETTEIGNVQYALDAIPQMNIGEGAFQYSQDAIDAARLLVQGEAGVEDVEEAHKALQTLNQPKEGQLFNIINISNGYNHANKALTFKAAKEADFTAEKFTTMGWSEKAGSMYPQAVKLTPVEDVLNGYTISYTRADGKDVYVATGKGAGFSSDTRAIRPTTTPAQALTMVVEVIGDHQWRLLNTESKAAGSNYLYVGANEAAQDDGFYTSGTKYASITFAEAAETEYALTVAAENQYGTLIVPFDTEIPEDLTVYAVNGTEGSLLTMETVDEIKANVPYIVFAESGIATTTLSGLGNAYTDTEYTDTEGMLTGLYAEKEITEGYVLQNQGGVVAFYQVNAEKPVKVTANRAYLKATDGIDVKGAYFFDDEATGIQNVLNAFTTGNVEVFNASGVRQNGLQKGLNIIRMEDGSVRKVMVK